MVQIRDERPADFAAVRDLHIAAFGGTEEADIVDAVRSGGAAMLSLVAVQDGRVVGHIMYSPATIDGRVSGAALGPMAVVPECQRRGFGSRLVETGNRTLQQAGCPFVVVVGHPAYYPRFGFEPAASRGVRCEWDVPEEAFMLLVLDAERMNGVAGLAKYRAEFSAHS